MSSMRAPGFRYVEPAVLTTVASTRETCASGARSSNSSKLVSRRTSIPVLFHIKSLKWRRPYNGRVSTDPIKVLLQTTIEATVDDWSIERFSLLGQYLRNQRDANGAPMFEVTMRDRENRRSPDPVLSTLDRSDFHEMWLFAVDVGDGLTAADCSAISRFRAKGRGLLVTRDHMDLGSSICDLGGVGEAHHFHSRNLDPDTAQR